MATNHITKKGVQISMNLGNVFHNIVDAGKHLFKDAGKVLGILEKDAPTIEQAAHAALPIIHAINAMAPNRTFDELEALASKFNLHLTKEISESPIEVETLLQNSVLREIQKALPTFPNSLLRSGIALAFNTFKADKAS